MSAKFRTNIQNLKNLSMIIKDANKPAFYEIIEKYKNQTIKRIDTALNLVMKLSNARGTGQSKAKQTIANFGKPKMVSMPSMPRSKAKPKQTSKLDVGIDDDEGILIIKNNAKTQSQSRSQSQSVAQPVQKTFHITANVKCKITFISKVNKKTYEHKVPFNNVTKTIEAGTIDEAKQMFMEECLVDNSPNYSRGKTEIENIEYISIVDESELAPTATEDMMMRRAKPIQYNFFPEVNEKHEKNDGFCVFNTFVATYSQYIKKLTQERFIELCYQVRGVTHSLDKDIVVTGVSTQSLDKDIVDEDEPELIKNRWIPADGVSPKMLFEICQILKISHYAFDVTNKCFLKYVSEKNHSYPALVYYAVNDHMYHIKDANAVKKLVSKTISIENKINSSIFSNADDEKVNIYTAYTIKEDIAIKDLEAESKSVDKGLVIYYTQINDLEAEFEQIISHYNLIPKIKNKRSKIIQIKPFKNIELYMVIDPNYSDESTVCDYKKIQELCKLFNIEFRNQTFNGLISEVRTNFYDNTHKRYKFSKAEREEYFANCQKCAQCDKEVNIKSFHLDHIRALANGGTNEKDNIQMLCIACHLDKTNCEREDGYVRLNDTESSFNDETREIFNSKQYGSFAFVDNHGSRRNNAKKYLNHKIYSLDLNKCRRNVMLHNKQDYPVFTVLDKVEPYALQTNADNIKPGLYFVETTNYFPMRGNRWYHHTIVKYCLEVNIISQADIKFQVVSGLTLKADYFNQFIQFLSSKLSDEKELLKLAVNGMIGKFKPKQNENWSSICIQENSNNVFHHFLNYDGCFIKTRNIDDRTFYHAYKKYFTEKDESESVLYHMILELESIELHKMSKIIESNNGIILDLNTDAISFITKDNKLPFEVIKDSINIDGYYYDQRKLIPKYKLEDKEGRLCIPKLQGYKSCDKYELVQKEWKTIQDVSDNDFKPLVNQVINPETKEISSCLITARAGCGKSHLIKQIQAKLDECNIDYVSLGPTNKSCIQIQGETLHRFTNRVSNNIKAFESKVIIIDEISMMLERFYKFFSTLKRIKPDTKFILVGDYNQLKPVNDRVSEKADYECSPVVYELCDGKRIQLSKCRRSDDKIYNMCLPENIDNIKKTDFAKTLCKINISYTNQKRKNVNAELMQKFSKDKVKVKVPRLKYCDKSQDVIVFKGLPIISRKNTNIKSGDKNFHICNNEMFTVGKLNEDRSMVDIISQDDEKIKFSIPIKLFTIYFNPAYCVTIHTSQGITIKENYTIHEFDRFDQRLKYVAISRAQNVNQLNFN